MMAKIWDALEKISRDDIVALERRCLEQIQEDVLYAVRNDAKLRAVATTKNYEEFKNIVDSAHLTPLSASDKQNAKTKHRIWNSAAKSE
uniref:Dynein attachment factor N-terminal domain-containing protein n=1 Tax=Anopheles atroparvus TaxID=41427 RepID=A0AAG5D102_ANOAO